MAKYALLIGVGSYQNANALEPSLTARSDVEAVREVLLHSELGGFAQAVALLDPDRIAMEEAIEEFFRKLGRDDLGLLLFAGRGVRDRQGKAYFSTQSTRRNCDGELVKATAIPARVVQDIMGSSPARQQVMILDCGFRGLDPADMALYNGSLNLRGQLGGQGRVILLGSEAAYPLAQNPNDSLSPYTHWLVEGITTGKADRNQDQLVSVDELHDYVLEHLQPLLTQGYPELIVTREEDRAINLARVRHFDPALEYRQQVENRVEEGQFSPVGRAILDRRRMTLGLSAAMAQAIEEEVLRPFREHAKDLQRYRQALMAALRLEYPLGPKQQAELKEFQSLLELADAEVEPIQQSVMQPFAEQAAQQQQNQAHYEQAFREAIAFEYPLSTPERLRLRQQQRTLDLSDAQVQALEAQVLAADQEQRQRYHRALQQFELAWRQALTESYPADETTQRRMQKLQHSLGIQPEQAEAIAQRAQQQVEQERAAHQANRDRYRATFLELVTQSATLRKPQRDRLAQVQRDLGLSDADILAVEDQATAKLQAQRQHQKNLAHYQQECARLLQEEYPLSEAKQQDLTRLQHELHLSDAEATQIFEHLKAQAEVQRRAYAQALSRYEQDYQTALALESPLSPASREQLDQTWRSLGLTSRDVHRLEQRMDTEQATRQQEKARHLRQYEQAYEEATQRAYPLEAEPRSQLTELGRSLQLTLDDIGPIEARINAHREAIPAPDPTPDPTPAPPLDRASAAPANPTPTPDPTPSPHFDPTPSPPPDSDFMPTPPPTPAAEFGTPPAPPRSTVGLGDDLSSEHNLEYSLLQELLKDGLWEKADQETFRMMLMATHRNQERWLSPASLENFPCLDLATISKLWDKYSNGHFGFLAQERIYRDIFPEGKGGRGDRKRVIELGVKLKWIWKAGNLYPLFRNYTDLDFAIEDSVLGHLPALWFWKLSPMAALQVGTVGTNRSFGGADIQMFSSLMRCLKECNIH